MERGSKRMQILSAVTASLTYLACGAYSTWNSPVIPKLQDHSEDIYITADQGSWMASFAGLPSIVILLLVGHYFDFFGRKTLILMSAPFLVVCFTWQIFASTFWELLVSRIIGGLGTAFVGSAIPAYLVEISTDDIRGALVATYQVMLTVGDLLVYCVGPYVSLKWLSVILLTLPILFFVTFVWMPESPYYLLQKGRRDDATKSLLRLRGLSDPKSVETELQTIEQTLAQQGVQEGGLRHLLFHAGNRRTLLVMLGFVILGATSGILPIQSYTNEIFLRAGASLDANVSAIIVGVVQVLASMLAPMLVDRLGRRPLLLMSFAGCTLSLFSEGAYFYLKDEAGIDVTSLGWLPLTALVVFIVTYTAGIGGLVWIVPGELLASSVKGVAMSILLTVYLLVTVAIVKLFQVVADWAGIYVVFWGFGVLCFVGFFYVFLLIPETKNRSLMDINEEMNAKAGMTATGESRMNLTEKQEI